ncbi:DUF5412 family protein [Brevibacillus fulvus]|uniref:DUF5412 domain-containing protein n=1 Tax=Brevibacillus fulvus TaxID=1125967 RepID=A0A938Y4H4_9BACL|nr:DUF5412 family protein [Brevibacillus fulvus]MBM7591070.1 hypothetical protein [Brevibacillus fulvus]
MKLISKLIGLTVLVAIVIFIKVNFYPSLESIDTKKLQVVSESVSPDGKYRLKTYLMGGVLLRSDYTYIGEIEYGNERRKVFWISGDKIDSLKWIDNKTIEIAGKKIDILSEYYDFRSDF